jgi:hypothetical protein
MSIVNKYKVFCGMCIARYHPKAAGSPHKIPHNFLQLVRPIERSGDSLALLVDYLLNTLENEAVDG